MYLVMKMAWFIQFISDETLEDYMDLLLIADKNKSHYVYIKVFNRFMRSKIKHKNKKLFCRYRLQSFSSEKVLKEDKDVCLKINCRRGVKSRDG